MKDQNADIDSMAAILPDNLFQIVLNNMEDAYILIDKNFLIIESNQAARTGMWNKTGTSLSPGTDFLSITDPERVPMLKALFAEVLRGKKQKTEYSFALADGDTLHLENNLLPARTSEGDIIGIIVYSKNITEKKLAELKIKEAEERWQFALDAANQAAWDWNLQTNEVIYSTSYKKMYGFGGDELTNDVQEWYSRIHPDDRKLIESDLQSHLQSDNPYYETTYRIQFKGGDYKWILARGKILEWDAAGKPLRMIGTHTDLTETLEAEEQLRKMNERFVFASKATAQALWEWDAVTGQAYVSETFTQIFGWAADEDNYFEQWHHYIHPDDKEETINGYYHTLNNTANTTWEASYRFLKKDGSYAVVADRAYILRDEAGQAVKVIGATQDITSQKKTEAELFQSNERYNLMLQATNELLWEWDVQADEVSRSKEGLAKVYRMKDDSLVKTHVQWLSRIHPDDLERVKQSVADAYGGKNLQQFELDYRFLNGEGNYSYLNSRGILLTDAEGKPIRMIGSEQDITERKRLEQELLNNELAYKKLINQATVDSQEQERSEIGRELHDNINQVLTTTKLYLELALSNPEMQTELVKKGSKNISAVINEIRQLSRSLMDPTLGDLGLVDSLQDLIENINLTRKISIALQIDAAIEKLIDGKQKLTIFRIIQESLNNVIRHARAKEVKITVEMSTGRICLTILDDGIGFSQDSVKKGAGLKNISNRVYLINGEFRLKSEPGKGCEINICFPIK
jgi:PAS domain S-box-containing protein